MGTTKNILGGMCFFILASWICAPGAVQAGDNQCILCHRGLAPSSEKGHGYVEWERSAHAKAGITCDKCHGGDPAEPDAQKTHQTVLKSHRTKSPLYYTQIPETCGTCHVAELDEFKKSAHYKELKDSEHGPNCVTCHGSMAIRIPEPRQLSQTCSVCHRERDMAREALVTLNFAGSALKKWGDALETAKKRGALKPEQEAALKVQKEAFTQVRRKWHAFAMKDVVEESKKINDVAIEGLKSFSPSKE